MEETQKAEVNNYLNNFIEKFKQTEIVENLDNIQLLKESIKRNSLNAIIIWFFGTTVIGIPAVFGLVLYRGFCLGYTISTCISIMGVSKGLLFVLISIFFQNILVIPSILGIAVSGIKLYKSIVKDNRRENVKLEIMRHILFSIIMLLILIIASFIEIFISTNFLRIFIKYF